jgi:phosphoribosylformylglycinamidine (FGAM) synthase-like enzyme
LAQLDESDNLPDKDDLILTIGQFEQDSNSSDTATSRIINSSKKSTIEWISKAYQEGLIHAYRLCDEGGLSIALAKLCLAGNIGATVKLRALGRALEELLFDLDNPIAVVAVSPDFLLTLHESGNEKRIPVGVVGRFGGNDYSLTVASRQWDSPEERELIYLPVKEIEAEWKKCIVRRMS